MPAEQPEVDIKTDLETHKVIHDKERLDEPLVSFSIQNPFKRLLYWINDFRKKQTTTFDFKIKIPLLALPIFLALLGSAFQIFFSLGKSVEKKEIAALPTPTPVIIIQPTTPPLPLIISRLGTIKATYHLTPTLPTFAPVTSPNDQGASSSGIPTSSPKMYPEEVVKVERYVLIDKNEELTFLVIPKTLSLNNYLNQRVLVTGLFDQNKNFLTIEKNSDIELMP